MISTNLELGHHRPRYININFSALCFKIKTIVIKKCCIWNASFNISVMLDQNPNTSGPGNSWVSFVNAKSGRSFTMKTIVLSLYYRAIDDRDTSRAYWIWYKCSVYHKKPMPMQFCLSRPQFVHWIRIPVGGVLITGLGCKNATDNWYSFVYPVRFSPSSIWNFYLLWDVSCVSHIANQPI